MKMYMGYDGEPKYGAVLIFAHTAKEARPLAFKEIKSWQDDVEWINVRIKLIKGKEFLFKLADKEKLEKDIPHAIDDLGPATCKSCECWGEKLNENGICESCLKEVIEA